MAHRFLVAIAAALALAGAVHAALPVAAADIPQARIAGQGAFSWFGMKIYDARLWVGQAGYAPGAPFALELRYARSLGGARIAEASDDQMEKNGAGTSAQRATWLRRMRALFPDVTEGSTITGVFLADGGVRFYLDGKVLGTIAEPGFAAAFAGIWLSPATTAPRLRASLLRDAAPR